MTQKENAQPRNAELSATNNSANSTGSTKLTPRQLKLPLEMGVLSFVQNVDKELRNGGKASTCGIHAGI